MVGFRPHWSSGANGSGRFWPRLKPAAKDRAIGTLCTPVKSAYFDRAVLLRLHLNSKAWEEGKSLAVLLAKQYGTQPLIGIDSDLSGSRLWGHGTLLIHRLLLSYSMKWSTNTCSKR